MSASQLAVVVLIVVAFALGWWGREWRHGREAHETSDRDPGLDVLDEGLRSVQTAFQAALSVWQAQPPAPPGGTLPGGARSSGAAADGAPGGGDPADPADPAARAWAAFDRRRAALAAIELGDEPAPELRDTLARAARAVARLADGLEPLTRGEPLERAHERSLVAAERALSAARCALPRARPSPRGRGGGARGRGGGVSSS